jgi:hypothetical protein
MNMLFQPITFGKRVVFEVAAEGARFRSLRSICQSAAVLIVVLLSGVVMEALAGSQPDPTSDEPLKQLSLAQLGEVEVTTASKEPEEVWKTPAAVYVLTNEDIRRSGATSIPEALRLVPGVQVSRIDNDHWAVAIRGFADQFSKSMLVMVDGRSLGSASNGAAEILRRIYGEGGHFITLSNPAVPDIVLQYTTFKQITDDISDARVYGGIHFRTDQVAGERLGKAVGKVVYKNNLRPIHDDD